MLLVLVKSQVKSCDRPMHLRAVKQRLHQASFRKAVITAYDGRCALSGLPECFRFFTFTQNFDLLP